MYVFNTLINMYKSFDREQTQSLANLLIFLYCQNETLILWENLVPHLKGHLIL